MDPKLYLTIAFANELGLESGAKNLELLHRSWWQNPRLNGERSFRLTDCGYKALAHLKFYQIEIPESQVLTSQTIIWLDKFIDCPYYLEKKTIWVSREKVAVQLILFGGDLTKFGKAKEDSQNNC